MDEQIENNELNQVVEDKASKKQVSTNRVFWLFLILNIVLVILLVLSIVSIVIKNK